MKPALSTAGGETRAWAHLEHVQHDGDEQAAGAQHDDEGHRDDVQRYLRTRASSLLAKMDSKHACTLYMFADRGVVSIRLRNNGRQQCTGAAASAPLRARAADCFSGPDSWHLTFALLLPFKTCWDAHAGPQEIAV